MGLGPANILSVKTLIEIDGGIDPLHDGGWAAGEAATPNGTGGSVGHDKLLQLRGKAMFRINKLLAALSVIAAITALQMPTAPAADILSKYIVPVAAGSEDIQKRSSVPDVTFTDASGMQIHLQHFTNHVVILNFWSSGCSPCLKQLASFDRAQEKLGADGLIVIPLAEDQISAATIGTLFQHQKISTPAALHRFE